MDRRVLMKKIHNIAVIIVLLLVLEWTVPGKLAMANEIPTDSRDKIYFEWMQDSNFRNRTGDAIIRKTTVDYHTGLFTSEDTVVDYVDKSSEYNFRKIKGMNTKNPLISYSILQSGSTEKIVKYDSRTKVFSIIANRNTANGRIDGVYPDANMYVVEKGSREYLVYSISTNKLIHTAKERPTEHNDIFVTNVLYRNYFDPAPKVGALYVEAGLYFDSKNYTYVTYPGEFPYEIRPDGSKLKLKSYQKNNSDDFVYKRTLSSSVVYKQTKKKRSYKHELIIHGKSHTLLESDTSRANYAFGIAQFSPHGKYVVLWVNYTENGRRVKGKEEYRIFDTSNGKLIQTIPINSTGSSSAIDYGMSWMGGTDHIIQSGLLNFGAYRIVGSDLMTPRRYGNVVDYSHADSYFYTFGMDNYLTINDPIPVKFKGKYMQYGGQGSFRTTDLTIYSPVDELVKLLGGNIDNSNGKITVTYQESSFTLNRSKQIVWKNRVYYPLRELLTGISLKLLVDTNYLTSNDWRELQIIK